MEIFKDSTFVFSKIGYSNSIFGIVFLNKKWYNLNKWSFYEMVNLSFYYERKTKMKINIIPLKKIEIDGKSIELGMKREQVIGILGLGELSNRHFF